MDTTIQSLHSKLNSINSRTDNLLKDFLKANTDKSPTMDILFYEWVTYDRQNGAKFSTNLTSEGAKAYRI